MTNLGGGHYPCRGVSPDRRSERLIGGYRAMYEPVFKPQTRGNPRLGRETKKERAKRAKTFADMNLISCAMSGIGAREEDRFLSQEAGISIMKIGSGGVDKLLDEVYNPNFWR